MSCTSIEIDVSSQTSGQNSQMAATSNLLEHWPQVDPQFILNELKALDRNDWPSGKQFYKSYNNWNKLQPDQRAKTKAYWTSLAENVKIASARRALAAEDASSQEASGVTESINKHEKARILHLRMSASALSLWTKLGRPLNRTELDDKEERQSTAQRLVAMYNDRKNFVFQNETVEYIDDERATCPLTGAYVAREGYDQLAAQCWQIDPQAPDKPERDSGWLLKHWKILRTELTQIREKFKLSGNQDAENKSEEWIKFCGNYSDVHAYAISIIPYGVMSNLGKATPDEVQRDTGILGSNGDKQLSNTLGANNRRRQRKRKREMDKADKGGGGSSVGSDGSPADFDCMTSMLKNSIQANERSDALKFLAMHGDPTLKSKALDEIARVAFGSAGALTGIALQNHNNSYANRDIMSPPNSNFLRLDDVNSNDDEDESYSYS